MTNLQRRLVELYAMGPAEEVHASTAFQQFYDKNGKDEAFNGERERVENLRRDVDRGLGTRTSYRDQVEAALRLLRRQREEKREACRELILLSYGKSWEDRQLSYFEEKSLFIMQARSYFLSFTNRNPNRPGLNLVNRDHEFLIKHLLGAKIYDHSNQSDNLLAKAVNSFLGQQLKGFYYPQHEEDNAKVEDKLRNECGRAFAFVQLVQGEIFRYYKDTGNWCHFEYKTAKSAGVNRILFVQIEEQLLPDDIDTEFEPWFQEFVECDAIKLTFTRWYNRGEITAAREKMEKLFDQIRDASDWIYKEIPN